MFAVPFALNIKVIAYIRSEFSELADTWLPTSRELFRHPLPLYNHTPTTPVFENAEKENTENIINSKNFITTPFVHKFFFNYTQKLYSVQQNYNNAILSFIESNHI